MDFFQITCFKDRKNMVVEKKLEVTINFYKKECPPVIKRNKKHLLRQVLSVTYTLEKRFFAFVTLEICESFLFRQKKNLYVHSMVCMSFLWISGEENVVFMKSKLNFFNGLKLKFIMKKSSSNFWLFFLPIFVVDKIIFGYNFCNVEPWYLPSWKLTFKIQFCICLRKRMCNTY